MVKARGVEQTRLLELKQFKGTVRRGSNSTALHCGVSVSLSGELLFSFSDVPLSNESMFLSREQLDGDRFSRFEICAESDDGWRLTSDFLTFSSVSIGFDDTGSFLRPIGRCVHARLIRQMEEPVTHPTVRYLFRGFRCFKSVSLQSIVGELNIGGNYNVTDYNRITGFLIAEKSNNDAHQVSEWYTDANRLLDHVMLIMSFASGTYLRVPVKEYFCGREVRTEFYNVSKVDEPTWPAFRSLDLLPIFTSAVDSFDSLSKRVRMLNFAVEWMLLPTTYNEVRLISRMTVLENLLYHNFEKNNEFLGASRFGKFAKKVKDLIRDLNIEEDTAEMSKKVGELNRRSLKARIEALLKEWGVPMADLPDDSVGEIVAARNRIVHRGVYDEPEENNQKELFYHVVLLNEIVTRVLLTLLRFRGHYECYLGGHHRRSFPECRRV